MDIVIEWKEQRVDNSERMKHYMTYLCELVSRQEPEQKKESWFRRMYEKEKAWEKKIYAKL
ncbi:MAG: hypothetical protein IJZ23_09620 [Roseburia sp.]|nr:hypothetical protein [Roseburia sp.]